MMSNDFFTWLAVILSRRQSDASRDWLGRVTNDNDDGMAIDNRSIITIVAILIMQIVIAPGDSINHESFNCRLSD